MDEIRQLSPTLSGTKLEVRVSIWDWHFLERKAGYAKCVIYSSVVNLRFLGGPIRTFKPGKQFNVQVIVILLKGAQNLLMKIM